MVNSSLAACARLHTAVFAHEGEYFLPRNSTAMSSRTASSGRFAPCSRNGLVCRRGHSPFCDRASASGDRKDDHSVPIYLRILVLKWQVYSFFGYLNGMLHFIFIRYCWQFNKSKAKYIYIYCTILFGFENKISFPNYVIDYDLL